MKYRVQYTYFDQTVSGKAEWEQRQKNFLDKLQAQRFVQKIIDNVSVRNVNIQLVP